MADHAVERLGAGHGCAGGGALPERLAPDRLHLDQTRNGLANIIETANRDREPITITRNGADSVVVLSAEEYAAMEETLP